MTSVTHITVENAGLDELKIQRVETIMTESNSNRSEGFTPMISSSSATGISQTGAHRQSISHATEKSEEISRLESN